MPGTKKKKGQVTPAVDREEVKRKVTRKQLEKLIDRGTEILDSGENDKDTISELKAIINGIRSRQETLSNLDSILADRVADDETAYEDALTEADDYDQDTIYALTRFEILVQESTAPKTQPERKSRNVSGASRKVNLPKLSLACFSGERPLEWQTFIETFESAIDCDTGLSNIQKFQYLRSQLSGEAANVISQMKLSNDNYTEALQLLKDRYGQGHKLRSAYMEALWKLPPPSDELSSIVEFHDNLESYIRGLAGLGRTDDTYGELLIPIILEKLPRKIRKEIAREHGDREWSLSDLRAAIRKEIEVMRAGDGIDEEPDLQISSTAGAFLVGNRHNRYAKRSSTYDRRNTAPPRIRRPCGYCKDTSHPSEDCNIFRDYGKRIEIVKRDSMCFNCLGSHQVKHCKSRSRCRHCNRSHHSSICNTVASFQKTDAKFSNKSEECAPRVKETTTAHVHYSVSSRSSESHPPTAVLLKTAVATISAGKRSTNVNVLFDEGAQRSFITERAAKGLQLSNKTEETINLSTFGANSPDQRRLNVAQFKLHTMDDKEFVALEALVIPEIGAPLRNHATKNIKDLPHLKGLKLAEPCIAEDMSNIDVLIGADFYWSIVGETVVKGPGPTAVSSRIGYLLSGPTKADKRQSPTTANATILHVIADHREGDNLLQQFWDLEAIGVKDNTDTPEGLTYEDYSKDCLTMQDGHYVAQLPWKSEHPPLAANYGACAKRTRSTIGRLTDDTLMTYNKIITEQTERGFIEKVQEDDVTKGHYIPHHAVQKDSDTTPIRIVFDCSYKTNNTPSLNECLEQGPSLLNDLTSILMRFRLKRIAVSSDIEKAFLNVGLAEEDRDFVKFLWLSDPTDRNSLLVTYRFRVVLFGAVCSPFILNAVVRTHLEKENSQLARDINENTYVDNLLSGTDTEEESISYYHEANRIMSDAGFTLRSWTSNSQELRDISKEENLASKETTVNQLGMKWDTVADTLTFKQGDLSNVMTKREIVSSVSSIYDPLGLLSPVTVTGKLLIQELWKRNISWDEEIPADLEQKWTKIRENLRTVSTLTLQRQYFQNDPTESFELHVFSDASPKSYGAAVYLVQNGNVSLVMAKSRVAPTKETSLPRLELLGSLIAVRLLKHCLKTFSDTMKIAKCVLWSDSQIVLHWINSEKKLPIFVENRVKEIRSAPVNDFKYCPTKDNPSDLLTRGITTDELNNSGLWWKGPPWLGSGDWPVCELFDSKVFLAYTEEGTTTEPAVSTETPKIGIHKLMDIERFGTLSKLLRVTALVLRFVAKLKKDHRKPNEITPSDLQIAETLWIKGVQQQEYEREYRALRDQNKKLGPLVKQLKLFVDENNIIRCGGRLHNAPINYDTKFPILLPAYHRFSYLIIRAEHFKLLHSGVEATMTGVRQRYWITKTRQAVKSALRNCVICKLVIGKPYRVPVPPPLQSDRLLNAPAFTVTGLDYTGFMYVKDGHRGNLKKAYICLFTCAVTRAIHLEVVPNLTPASFLYAFRRFAARRSLPSKVISDNASTFIVAKNELSNIFKDSNVKTFMAQNRVDWKFIPKRAPNFGGFYERLVGLTKTALKKTLGRALVTMEELCTITCEIEAVLNDRPLTHFSPEVEDSEPLTPSHLLHGHRLTALPHRTLEEISDPDFLPVNKETLDKRVNYIATLHNRFWSRWSSEYLTALRERHFTKNKLWTNQIKINDVVLVHSDTEKRLKWKMAVVEKLHFGNDGLVRSADIRLSNGRTNRPICKLYPLEITCEPEVPQDNETPVTTNHEDNLDNLPVTTNLRPVREASTRARQRLKAWADTLLNN